MKSRRETLPACKLHLLKIEEEKQVCYRTRREVIWSAACQNGFDVFVLVVVVVVVSLVSRRKENLLWDECLMK